MGERQLSTSPGAQTQRAMETVARASGLAGDTAQTQAARTGHSHCPWDLGARGYKTIIIILVLLWFRLICQSAVPTASFLAHCEIRIGDLLLVLEGKKKGRIGELLVLKKKKKKDW